METSAHERSQATHKKGALVQLTKKGEVFFDHFLDETDRSDYSDFIARKPVAGDLGVVLSYDEYVKEYVVFWQKNNAKLSMHRSEIAVAD